MSRLVSIIVPVYNVEKYLDRCVQSLVKQTYSDVEIILVDDKATDASGLICDEWSKKSSKIKVIHKKKNEGLGFARNTGLKYATGDLILFVDSDDYIDPLLCEKTINAMEQTSADICYFGHKKDVGGTIIESDLGSMKDEYSGDAIIDDFLLNTISQDFMESGPPKIDMSAWRIMYKADIIRNNNLQFCSERDYLNEDLFFRIQVVKCIKKVTVIHENLYYYFFNNSSLTTSYREDRFEASKRMYAKLVLETSFCDAQKIYYRCQRAFMNNLLVCIRQEIHCKNRKQSFSNTKIKEYCEDDLVKKIMAEYPIESMSFQSKMLYSAIKNKQIFKLKLLVILKDILKRAKKYG